MNLFQLLIGMLHSDILCALDSFQRLLGIVIECHIAILPFVLALLFIEC